MVERKEEHVELTERKENTGWKQNTKKKKQRKYTDKVTKYVKEQRNYTDKVTKYVKE